jgi:nucleotide-binding universal stress UspA family protein
MGRDRIVTDWLNEIHPKFATPYRSIVVTGGMIVFFIAFLGRDIEVLAKAASVLHLVVYALMNAALIVYRETDAPDYDPDFTVPLYPITPIVGMVLSLGLLAFVGVRELLLSAVFVVGAVAWYFIYAREYTPKEGHLGRHVRDRGEEMPDSVVGVAEAIAPNGTGEATDVPTVMVALANPRTERALVTFAGALAKARGGSMLATNVVRVPDQTSLAAAEQRSDLGANSEELLRDARSNAERFDVPVETLTIYSHQGVPEIFDAARERGVDAIVMGYGGVRRAGGRVEGPLGELAHDLPCDVLVLDDGAFDPSEVLLPTAGGYSSDLSAEVARALRDALDAEVSILYVASEGREAGREFIEEWAADQDLDDAELLVETGDVGAAIEEAAADRTMVVIGATGKGLLSRIVRGSLTLSVLETLDVPVVLAERPRSRSLRERLFG